MPTNISGGMRKRVGLARALALEPPLETGAPAGTNETLRRATVTIDGLPANMHYSGTAPGFVCLYQIDAPVPQEARIGDDILLFIEIGGRLNNVVTIALAP